jgi:hypothetical protein
MEAKSKLIDAKENLVESRNCGDHLQTLRCQQSVNGTLNFVLCLVGFLVKPIFHPSCHLVPVHCLDFPWTHAFTLSHHEIATMHHTAGGS